MVKKTKNSIHCSLLFRVTYGFFVVLCCALALSIVPIGVYCAMIVRKHPVVLLAIFPLVCFAWMGLKVLRKRRWRMELTRGCDFGLQKDWLSEVPRLLDLYGVSTKKSMPEKFVLPPKFREVAVRYGSVRRKKGPALFSRKLMAELRIGCKDGKDYYCFAGQDEVYYCVRVSDSDETIYKLELEWSMPPVPFASDINHYFALRYFHPNDD